MYEKLSKKARNCMLVNEIISGVVMTVIFFIIQMILKSTDFKMVANLIWIVIILEWVVCIVLPFVRYERYRYRFTDEEIDVKEGFLFVNRNVVPIERLHKVAMASGPIDRIFGLSKVIVTTAGGDVTIRFLENEKAEKIVDTLKTRINHYAVQARQNELEKEGTSFGQ